MGGRRSICQQVSVTQKGDKKGACPRETGGWESRHWGEGDLLSEGQMAFLSTAPCATESYRHSWAGRPPPPTRTPQRLPVRGQQLFKGPQACNWGDQAAVLKSRMAGAQPLGTAMPWAFKEGGHGVGVGHILPRFQFLCWWKRGLRKLGFRGYCHRMKSILVHKQAFY